MCGICGILGNRTGPIQQMNRIISHRGPDEKAIIIKEDSCLLGMSRLKIKGNSSSKNQFYFLNKKISVVFNGEIYNYSLLKAEMLEKGFKLETDLELELIALLYAYYGKDFAIKLDGMFAIVIYANNKLSLFRDRLGIKPLYYAIDQNGDFYFASEIKAILSTNRFSAEVNSDFLIDTLVFGFSVSKKNTPFKNIFQLQPGGYLIKARGLVDKGRYYSTFNKNNSGYNGGDYQYKTEKVKSLFENAIEKMFLHDDVAKGVCLSGGFDSSLIALLGAKKSKEKIYTYTLTSDQNSNNEDVLYAQKVADQIGSIHKLINIDADEAWSKIPHFVYHHESVDFGGVFDPNGGLAFHLVLEHAAKNNKVVFSGEGADELFCGYGKLHGSPNFFLSKLKSRALKLNKASKKIWRKYNLLFPAQQSKEFYQKVIYNLLLAPGLYNYHLQCVDRSSSAFGAELRPVFLDTELFEYAKTIDLNLNIDDIRTKMVLKDAFLKDFNDVGLGNIVTRKKLAMPTALESLQKTFAKKIEKCVSMTPAGPYDCLFVSPEEKVLFDLFYYIFIKNGGSINDIDIPPEELINETEFQRMYDQ